MLRAPKPSSSIYDIFRRQMFANKTDICDIFRRQMFANKTEYLTGVDYGLHMSNPRLPPSVSESARPKGCVHGKDFNADKMSGRIHANEAEGKPDTYAARMDGGLAGQFECLSWSFSGADQ